MPRASTQVSSIKAAQYQRPWMYPKQENALFCRERYSIISGATKTGKTAGGMVWLAERAMFNGANGTNHWWISYTFDVARIAFDRLKRSLPEQLYVANDSRMTLTLPNGAIIRFRSADDPNALYGDDVRDAVCDEFTRWKEASWHAVRSTLTATRGHARMLGNVRGKGNFAYKLAQLADQEMRELPEDKRRWRHTVLTAYDAAEAGVIDWDEIEDARKVYPEAIFNELYLCIPSDDGGNPFGLGAIQRCIAPTLQEPVPGRRYVIGVDLAKSTDHTVCVVMDPMTHNVVACERWQSSWDETMNRIQRLASKYNKAQMLVDSTGVGDPILEQLQKMPYL